jgi:acetolactate synthase-1/2/3 large subunit
MKVSEYILGFLAGHGIREVFLITGGVITPIVDAFHGRSDISYICTQHEQAAAMAADGYARVTGKFGVAMGTSGPGATNLITGMGCSWFDSIPVLFITGQVNTFESKGNSGVRQWGFQETDIVEIVKPITKYAKLVQDPEQIRYELEKCIFTAMSGRPGPVLLDIPMNVQRAEIDEQNLQGFVPDPIDTNSDLDLKNKIHQGRELIKSSSRPVCIVGAGVRIAGAQAEFHRFVEKMGIPTVPSWAALDIMKHDHPLFVAQFGVYGNRAGNFAVQNADLIISIGTRLDTRMTGGKPELFARQAKKVLVDIDKAEISKRVKADVPIVADALEFLKAINEEINDLPPSDLTAWLQRISDWKKKYPMVTEQEYFLEGAVQPRVFIEKLCTVLPDNIVTVVDAGGNLTWSQQAFNIVKDRKIFSAYGYSPMGYSLPAAIGACIANERLPVVCTIGDGGLQMNIQEFQTLAHYKLPVKVFIMNNRSYGIIKQFQEELFDGRYEATDASNGYSVPDFVKIAQAYGLTTDRISSHEEIIDKVRKAIETPGPVICDVWLDDTARITPKTIFGNPIEDQWPFLDDDEFKDNMLIPPLPRKK